MNDRMELYVPGQPLDGGVYHYVESGLDNVFLKNGYTIENDPEYGKLVTFHHQDDLHLAISLNLIASKNRLTSAAFRFIRKQMKLSQAALASDFGVDAQTIANYEKGATAIPMPTDALLRVTLLLQIMPEDMKASFVKDVLATGVFPGRLRQSGRYEDGRNRIVESWKECRLPVELHPYMFPAIHC